MTQAVHTAMPESDYFRNPALSCSGAKLLLPPNCPAMYRWRLDNPQEHKQAFDVGHAAHAKVLGVGAPTVIVQKTVKAATGVPERKVDADDYKTVSAQEHAKEIRAEGKVPLLRHECEAVDAMAAAVLDHPIASALFAPGTGTPELSLFWRDDRHGIDKRARLDWLRPAVDGRAIAVDLKTCVKADPQSISRSIATYFYDMQAAHYSEGVLATGLAEDVSFLFVFVEKSAPHLITVCEVDGAALDRGQARMDRAAEVLVECLATDTWPSYSTDIELISLPRWASYEMDAA